LKDKAVQKLTKEQIAWGKKLSIEERVKFVEDFMRLAHEASDAKSKLISIKMPEDLLRLFKAKCASNKLTYQTQIKELMRKWVLESSS
jgi:predicted DNA binding CopG/RHH family protein